MKKKFRLKKTPEFKKVYKEGKRFVSPRFVLYMRESTLPDSRLGVSLSKSHFKLATRRNRLRRVTKELFKEKIFPFLKGYDFVLASRGGSQKAKQDTVENDLKRFISAIPTQAKI